MQTGHNYLVGLWLVPLLLGVRFLLDLADLLAALIMLHAPHLYDQRGLPLDNLQMALRPWALGLSLAGLGWWLYHYHWGFWNTWETAEKHFRAAGAPEPIISIRTAVLVFYANWVGSSLLLRLPALKAWPWLNLLVDFLDVGVYALVFVVTAQALRVALPPAETAAETAE